MENFLTDINQSFSSLTLDNFDQGDTTSLLSTFAVEDDIPLMTNQINLQLDDEILLLPSTKNLISSNIEQEKIKSSVDDQNNLLLLENNKTQALNLGQENIELSKDTLIGEKQYPNIESFDPLTGDNTNNQKIETRIATKQDKAGNSLKTSHNLGILTSKKNFQEFVGKSDSKDFYKFKVNKKTNIDIHLQGLSGNADLYLLNNQGKVIEKSVKSGKLSENIEQTLQPGVYYLRVQPKNNTVNANYNLILKPSSSKKKRPVLLSTPLPKPVIQNNLNYSNLDHSNDLLATIEFPDKFDLRQQGDVTSVKNQGDYGSCWAFASYASLESSILKANGTIVDLSENHLKNHNGFASGSKGPGYGGTHTMSISYLSRSDGPVNETDDPYKDYNDYPGKQGIPQYYAGNMLEFDSDIEMKQGLMNYGALYTSMAINWNQFSSDDTTYYYSDGKVDGYHAVAIVGWDDQKEIPGAPKNGAWLCKNSWGKDWGDNGYFWISYEDTQGANFGISFNGVVDADNYKNIYYYDKLGYETLMSSPYGLNTFTAQGNEALKAIGFYTQADQTNYQIKIYDDFTNGVASNLLAEKTGNIEYSGYHTISLDTPVGLKNGDNFYIALEMKGGSSPQAITSSSSGANSSGESYYSYDGLTWQKLANSNFCIKALTTSAAKTPDTINVTSPNGNNIIEPGSSYTITWKDDISENVKLELYKGNSLNSIISSSTESDGSYTWKVPKSITDGSDYKVKITSVVDRTVSDFSNNNFTIKSKISNASVSRILLGDSFDEGNISHRPTISDDERYISFISLANNLVPGDTNGSYDVFVHDLKTGNNTRVSVSSNGQEGNSDSSHYQSPPVMSSNGRYVAFTSDADNLVPGDTNGMRDIFLHDTKIGTTTRVSVGSNGTQANNGSTNPAISSNGRYVVFDSEANNLVPGDTNGETDVFLHDTQTGSTTCVSLSNNGLQGKSTSYNPTISKDGRYVAFVSYASNLVSGDTNGNPDVFVRDTQTNSTTRVSVSSNGIEGNDRSYWSSISDDGSHVLFLSYANNLVLGDTNGNQDYLNGNDVFVHNIRTGTTTRVSVGNNGTQGNKGSIPVGISSNGRYVVFDSEANNLVPGDTNGVYDVFLHDIETGTTTRVSIGKNGNQGNDYSGGNSISSNGRYILFTSNADNLVSGDNNNEMDVFVYDRSV